MIRDLLPLIAALALAAVVYAVRETHRRQSRMAPPLPAITVAETWERWQWGARNPSDHEIVPRGVMEDPVSGPVTAAAEEILGRAGKAFAEADHPRLALRQAILEQAVVALHLDAVSGFGEEERAVLLRGYKPGMDSLLQEARRASTLAWLVLRLHARLKYDDAAPGDWFHNFVRLAGPYIREKSRLARESVVRVDGKSVV